VLGASAALVERELAVGVDLALEPLEKLLAGSTRAGGSVVCAAPRDLSRDPLVDVFGRYGTSRPSLLRGVIVSVAALVRYVQTLA
jgi:hypothetical protein